MEFQSLTKKSYGNKTISKNLIAGLNKTNCKKIIISGTGAEYGDIKKACYEYSKPSKKISELGRQKNLIRKLFFEIKQRHSSGLG